MPLNLPRKECCDCDHWKPYKYRSWFYEDEPPNGKCTKQSKTTNAIDTCEHWLTMKEKHHE